MASNWLCQRNPRERKEESVQDQDFASCSSNFNETGSSVTSDDNFCELSIDKLRNQHLENQTKHLTERSQHLENQKTQLAKNQYLEKQIKQLKERHKAELDEKKNEVFHYVNGNQYLEKQMKQLKERHKAELDENKNEVFHYANSLKVLGTENQKMAKELQSKDRELVNIQKSFSEEHDKSVKLNRRLQDYDLRFSDLRDSYNEYAKERTAEIQLLESRLYKKDVKMRILHEELRNKTERLASNFEKKLKQDQRRVENTVELNTPSDVEKDFRYFVDGDRIDACDVMESMLESKEEIDVEIYYPRLACLIFVTAYEQVKEAKEAACDLFKSVTRTLVDEAPCMSQKLCLIRKEGGVSSHFPLSIDVSAGIVDEEISTDVLDGLMLSLKQTSHLCNLDCFKNVVRQIVRERWRKYLNEEETQLLPQDVLHQDVLTELGDYIEACIRLTWRMVTQVPPLQLEYKAVQFDKNIHKLTRLQHHSECTISENIACYLWPALLEAGGRIIFPGEVLCKLKPVNHDEYVMIQP